MKKSILLFAISGIFIFSANAQKTQWGVRVGGGISTRSGFHNELGLETAPIPTLQGGIIAIVPLAESFIVQPSLGYCGKGNKIKNIQFTDPTMGTDLGTGTAVYRADYFILSVPFQFRSILKNNVVILSGLGPYAGYLFGAVSKARNLSNGQAPEAQKVDLENAQRFDAGITLMMSFILKKKLIVSINYDQGFINTIKQGPIKSLNATSAITVGYIFK
jgi:hypothetical protein